MHFVNPKGPHYEAGEPAFFTPNVKEQRNLLLDSVYFMLPARSLMWIRTAVIDIGQLAPARNLSLRLVADRAPTGSIPQAVGSNDRIKAVFVA
jgi:hypothetical protein